MFRFNTKALVNILMHTYYCPRSFCTYDTCSQAAGCPRSGFKEHCSQKYYSIHLQHKKSKTIYRISIQYNLANTLLDPKKKKLEPNISHAYNNIVIIVFMLANVVINCVY